MHWWSWLTFPTAHNGWGFLWLCCSDPPLSPLLNWKKNSILCQSPRYYDYYCRRSSVPHRPPSGGNVCMRDPSPTRREECRRMLGHYMKSVQSFELELSPSSTNSSSHTSSLPPWLPRSSKKFRIWSSSFQQPSLKTSRAMGWEMVPGLLLLECNSVVELAMCQNIQQAHILLLRSSRRLELLATVATMPDGGKKQAQEGRWRWWCLAKKSQEFKRSFWVGFFFFFCALLLLVKQQLRAELQRQKRQTWDPQGKPLQLPHTCHIARQEVDRATTHKKERGTQRHREREKTVEVATKPRGGWS